jgi:predicted DNA primase small subunit
LKKKRIEMEVVGRELVFDIDVNDYTPWGVDDQDIDQCDRAWKVVAIGMELVKLVLRKHFGFHNFVLVYSGRRGAHLTVYDTRAYFLDDQSRNAIVAYLQPQRNETSSAPSNVYCDIINIPGFHKIYESHVQPFWERFCILPRAQGGMGALDGSIDKDNFMNTWGNGYAKSQLVTDHLDGQAAWGAICEFAKKSRYPQCTWNSLKGAVLCYVWPRLDSAVSTQRAHLTKSMFAVHPKTGRICLPVFGNPSLFDPSMCPQYATMMSTHMSRSDGREGEEAAEEEQRAARMWTLFNEAVESTRSFAQEHMRNSASETWVKSSLDEAHNGIYCMTGIDTKLKEKTGVVQCYPTRSRVCADVVRVYSAVASSADPTKVVVGFHTEVRTLAAVIPAGYSLPFRAKQYFPSNAFLEAILRAKNSPGTEVVCDRAYVCVDFKGASSDQLSACRVQMERLTRPLSTRRPLCSVNATWDTCSIHTVLAEQVKQHWKNTVKQLAVHA